jgi:hypothetical protein
MKIYVRLLSFVVNATLLGCDARPQRELHFNQGRDQESPFFLEPLKQIALLKSSEPVVDAQRAFRMRDYRLVGLGGMVIGIPRLAPHSDLRDAVAVKIISGIGEGADPDVTNLAEEYAQAYNLEILRLLTNNKK